MDSTQFTPPIRRSMTDAELHEALGNAHADEAGITAAMELLEQQAQLRDIEKMEYSAWELEMERNGSTEALLALENARRSKQGLEPLAQLPVIETTAPIADPVAHLNNLYAAAETPAEPEVIREKVAPQESQEPIAVLTPEEPQPVFEPLPDSLLEALAEAETGGIALAEAANETLDEFERLLAADTVVGAEDELTAIEEELDAKSEELVFNIVEEDPGVEFVRAVAIENVDLNSSPKPTRRSKSISQFWAWLAIGGSVLPIALAWFVHISDIAFTQAVLAIVLGTTASAIVIAIGALAGKRSGLPTLQLSRAAFGVYANAAPGLVLTLVRFFWTIAIIASVLVLSSDLLGAKDLLSVSSYSTSHWILISALVLIVAGAITLAIFGGTVLFRAQQIAGVVGIVAAITLIAATGGSISVDSLLAQPSTSSASMLATAALTFATFGLAWTSSGADFARKLSINSRGAAVVGWGFLALAVVPAAIAVAALAIFDSISFGKNVATSMTLDLASWITPWLGYGLLGAAAVSTIVILAMSLYSSNLNLHSIGIKLSPAVAQPVLGAAFLAAATFEFIRVGGQGIWHNLAGYAIVLGVPVAAWSGIFVSDILIRRIAYHEISLSRSYGFYKTFNWVNLAGWLIATALGLGLISSKLVEFSWTGYLTSYLANADFWKETSAGLVIAFAFGCLLPVLLGIPRIKRQEAEVLAIEARRDDLKDIFGLAD